MSSCLWQSAQIFINGIFNMINEFGSSEAVRPSLVIGSFFHNFIITSRLFELISDFPHPRRCQIEELCNGSIVVSSTNGKQHSFPFPFLWKGEFFSWLYFYGRCTARCKLSKKIKFFAHALFTNSWHAHRTHFPANSNYFTNPVNEVLESWQKMHNNNKRNYGCNIG